MMVHSFLPLFIVSSSCLIISSINDFSLLSYAAGFPSFSFFPKRSTTTTKSKSSEETEAIPKLELDGITQKDWINKRRVEILKFFSNNIYGIVPNEPKISTTYQIIDENPYALNGKATLYVVEITISIVIIKVKEEEEGKTRKNDLDKNDNSINSFSFPFRLFVPNNNNNNNNNNNENEMFPVFLLICNRDEYEIDPYRTEFSDYWPVPQIVDAGFATAAYWAGDIDPDDKNDDFLNGIHPLLDRGIRNDESWGTIAAWAYGASRILDVLIMGGSSNKQEQNNDKKLKNIDPQKVVVIGHSRGGKTALWAAANDERFAMAVSNNSGCTGAALSKRKKTGRHGETIKQINTVFPNWFCRNYRRYNNNEMELPVDQHMLLSLIAPRPVSVSSATHDSWADSIGEYISIRDAAIVWSQIFRIDSSLLPQNQPPPEHPIQFGYIHYHLRSGDHDLTVYDWQQHMNMAKSMFFGGRN